MDAELEAFKRDVNLTDYAMSRGYELNRKESSRASSVIENPDGDKLIVAKDTDSHWIYFSVRDDSDNGSVIDFHQNRTGQNLGRTRQALRPWVNKVSEGGTYTQLEIATPTDRQQLLREYHRSEPVTEHAYLESRGLTKEVMGNAIFHARIRTDQRTNALFPHFDANGFCGFEIKNHEFTGFSRGGEKGLWVSRAVGKKKCLVLCESAIDAVSYGVLYGTRGISLASTGGAWSEKTGELLQRLAELPKVEQVILGFDNDEDGDHHAEKARKVLEASGKELVREKPDGVDDWNKLLTERN